MAATVLTKSNFEDTATGNESTPADFWAAQPSSLVAGNGSPVTS
jgi:hypothetical protein